MIWTKNNQYVIYWFTSKYSRSVILAQVLSQVVCEVIYWKCYWIYSNLCGIWNKWLTMTKTSVTIAKMLHCKYDLIVKQCLLTLALFASVLLTASLMSSRPHKISLNGPRCWEKYSHNSPVSMLLKHMDIQIQNTLNINSFLWSMNRLLIFNINVFIFYLILIIELFGEGNNEWTDGTNLLPLCPLSPVNYHSFYK